MRASRRTFPRQLRRILFCALLSCVAGVLPGRGQSSGQIPPKWDESVRTLADNIAAAASPSKTISLDVKNVSSLGQADAGAIRHELEAELAHHSIRVGTATETAVRVSVTLSESADKYVWVAEIGIGDTRRVAIVDTARSRDTADVGISSMTLQRNLLWVQPEPMLDFASQPILGGFKTKAIALQPNSIGTSEISAATNRSFAVSTPISQPQGSRDLRGQLTITANGRTEAHVAENVCIAEVGITLSLYCGKEPAGGWAFPDGSESHYVPGRNFFKGFAITVDGPATQPSFYSAATRSYDHGSLRIQTELDGKARLYESGSAKQEATFSNWGDEIVTLATGCDSTWQVLVTGGGDWTRVDRIQIYEISGLQAVAVGQPLEFPGPILSLWPAADNKSARVVSRNLKTGMYEASIVSIACGN